MTNRTKSADLVKEFSRPFLNLLLLLVACLMLLASSGCSIRKMAVRKLGDAIASSSTTMASDDDPELIRASLPFTLKLMESLLGELPQHRQLLLTTSSSFTQYAYAFVQQDADEMEDKDLAQARAMQTRARKLYTRARDYGLRGLETRHPQFSSKLRTDPKAAVTVTKKNDVPLLYWTALAWGAIISLSKDTPDIVADLPIVSALIERALILDERFDNGSIHNFLITYEMSRTDASGDPVQRARPHFERAVELSGGQLASPFVSWAESVSVKQQNRAEFKSMLEKALAINPDQKVEWRLANLIMQHRAQWLLGRIDGLFAE